ncbi:MAG: hypothetical protein VX794_01970 [Nitrospinota bacterium]|nr:hypothetical protein [Nitrospinota bacterium]
MSAEMKSLDSRTISKITESVSSLFSESEYGLTFVLWDGTEIDVGKNVRPIKVHFTSLKIFKKIMLNPTAGNFAEAYCDQLINIEGDLFESIAAADSFDYLEIPFFKKVVYGIKIWMI